MAPSAPFWPSRPAWEKAQGAIARSARNLLMKDIEVIDSSGPRPTLGLSIQQGAERGRSSGMRRRDESQKRRCVALRFHGWEPAHRRSTDGWDPTLCVQILLRRL